MLQAIPPAAPLARSRLPFSVSPQDLLIAMNLGPRLTRSAFCRLALEMDTWLAEPSPATAALRTGVPATQIAKALEMVHDAGRLAGEERARAAAHGFQIVTCLDDLYPAALGELTLPPPVLYLRGRPEALSPERAVSIVGARRMDAYGRDCTRHFSGELARAGLSIVSGFAIGIDSLAHDVALENGATTVAVLGCGLDLDYPAGSRGRAAAIAESGALITEFPLGCQPRPYNFPIRNRLIAALADVTLVIQAKLRSGSLITANHALDLGRDVFAVPGRIFDELAMGNNRLIADGAHPALCAADVLERLGIEVPRPAGATTLDPAPRAALENRPAAPRHNNPLLACLAEARDGLLAEDLATATGQPLDQVLGALLELELEGRIERRPGPLYFARNPKV